MIIKYVCIEDFEVPILDEEGSFLNEDGSYYGTIPIKKGSQWNLDGTDTICGADLKLTNETNFIEISNERLEKYFVEMIDEATLFDSYDGPKIIVLPKTTKEDEIMEEAKKCFEKYCDEYLDKDHDYYLDDEYSEIGIKRVMFEGDMTDTVTDIEKETLYKVWQVKINEYPF
ncbi:hypothetical protein [Fusobacterium ulcerans]|uniref:hypothetical protein n=1 Tax=Fusobacterium ulcerans TaxID=861 RepID=UPI003FF0C6EF